VKVSENNPHSGHLHLLSWHSRREFLQTSAGERWYLVQTQPRRETGADLQLSVQGFRAYLPQLIKTIRHARKLRTVRVPVFPGYLFVILDISRDRWSPINGTFGVARIIAAENRPVPVPKGLIEEMLSRTGADGLAQLSHGLQPGQSVRVVTGPFAQLVGTLDRLDANGRVRVLLKTMGGRVPVIVAADALEART